MQRRYMGILYFLPTFFYKLLEKMESTNYKKKKKEPSSMKR